MPTVAAVAGLVADGMTKTVPPTLILATETWLCPLSTMVEDVNAYVETAPARLRTLSEVGEIAMTELGVIDTFEAAGVTVALAVTTDGDAELVVRVAVRATVTGVEAATGVDAAVVAELAAVRFAASAPPPSAAKADSAQILVRFTRLAVERYMLSPYGNSGGTEIYPVCLSCLCKPCVSAKCALRVLENRSYRSIPTPDHRATRRPGVRGPSRCRSDTALTTKDGRTQLLAGEPSRGQCFVR